MPISSPDEKQDNPLKHKSDSHQSVEKSSSPQSQQDSRNRIVDTTPKPSMAGFTMATPKGEVQEHDSFDRGISPIETHSPRLSKVREVARHVADGSEFPNEDDATSTPRKPHVSTSVASTMLPTSSAGLTQTLTSTSSTFSVTPGTTTQLHNNRRLPSSSQHPNFAALFVARNLKIASIQAKEQQQEDTKAPMSVETVLPEHQVKGAPAAASKTKAKRKRTPQRKSGQTSGRWTHEEHRAFLEGLKEFGREWKKVATRIPTRTSAQIRSHAQKYFAKLQRDQETSMTSQELMTGDVRGSATTQSTTTTATSAITPSVQKNIERLMADPQAVQREVEHTLRALRERYRLLQSQLERQQQRGHSPLGAPRKPVLLQQQQQPIVALEEPAEVGSVGSRKRSFQEMDTSNSSKSGQQQRAQNQDQDDQSSVTTNISASVASLGNEELIALHVLGGALPRNESSASLHIAKKEGSPASTKSTK